MQEIILIALFAVALVISIVLMIVVFYQVPSIEQKTMQIMAVSNWLVTLGNIISVTASPEKGAALGDVIMYIGGTFLSLSFFLICTLICKIPVKKIVTIIMLCINFAFIAAVFFDSQLHIIYTEITFYKEGYLTYSSCSYGWMFYVYLLWQFVYFVLILLCVLRCRKKTLLLYRHLGPTLRKFLICGIAAYFPYLLITLFNMDVEITGISCTLAITIFIWIINKNNVFPLRINSKDVIIDELDDILLVTTVDGSYEYANKKAKSMVEGMEYFPYGMKIEGMDKRIDSMIALMEDETLVMDDRIYRKKKLPFEYEGKHLGDIHWLRDETAQTNYVNEIVRLKEEADRANEAKSTFLAHMSHEIRTPINGVLGLDEMLLRDAKDSQTLEYADQIMRTGKSLLAIVNDVLDFSKIEAGKMAIVEAGYCPKRMLDDIILSIEPRADEKGLAVNKQIAERIPNGLMGDEIRVKQIITNLMTNAVKYTEKGSVTLKADYFEPNEPNPDYPDEPAKLQAVGRLFISVTDTGIGIKYEDMDKLYGSFERIENITTHKTEGTGLGMSITTKLLKLMGGRMRVKSEFGSGSTFSISIPQASVELKEYVEGAEASQAKRKEALFTAPEAEVLVVDDNKTNLVVAKGLLKRNSIKVDLSSSGQDCLEKITKKRYDIIFLDHRMPELDGIETFRRMQKRNHLNKDVPVVMMTADADSGARDYYLGLGMTEYISKPLNAMRYESLVSRLLPPEKVTFNKSGK